MGSFSLFCQYYETVQLNDTVCRLECGLGRSLTMSVIKKRIVGIVIVAMLVLSGSFAFHAINPHEIDCASDEVETIFILPYKYWRD
jgi:hypothetical protein